MANTIKQKRGTADPGASDLVVGELAINTTDGGVFTKTDGGAVVELGASINLDTSPQLGGDLASNGHDILVADADRINIGTGNDLQLYHDSTSNNSIIVENGGGNLILGGTNIDFRDTTLSVSYAKFVGIGAVELYYDNIKRFETTDEGVFITGDIALGDDRRIKLGTQDDLQIFHNSANNNSVIKENGSGSLVLSGDNVVIRNTAGTENKAQFNTDAAVKLYYNNIEKFETTSTGATVTGTCVATEFSGSGASLTGVVKTDATGISGASTVSNIVTISQADYDAISSPDASTIYYITS